MVISSKNTDRIWQALEAQPAKLIRLTTKDQKTAITGWNPAKQSKQNFFETQIKPFLISTETGGGLFVIQGRTDTRSKPIVLLEIEKEGEELKEAPISASPEQNRILANHNLISENAEYKYKCKFLQEENDKLKLLIQKLEEEKEDLAQTITEMEEEAEAALLAEEATAKGLTPIQQTLLSAAAPLIPKLSDALGLLLDRFLPQNPPNQPGPIHEENQIQYPINFVPNQHNGNG